MKKKVIFSLLCPLIMGLSHLAQAQNDTYTPVADQSLWSVSRDKYMTNGDTIINNKSYLKVYYQTEEHPFEFDLSQAEYWAAIRNDTVNKRIYGVYKENVPVCPIWDYFQDPYIYCDSTEYLLYDFSLQLDDTVTIATFPNINTSDYIILQKVRRVDYVELSVPGLNHILSFYDADSIVYLNDESQRRRILINTEGNWGNEQVWIEGIGSMYGLFVTSGALEVCGAITNLLCFEQNNSSLLSFPEFETDDIKDCFAFEWGGKIEQIALSSLLLYPNPSNGFINIQFQNGFPFGQISMSLYDISGKLLHESPIEKNDFRLDIQHYPAGIYLITIQSDKKVIGRNKIIKY